ncbi:MAG: hypothetical protein BYD32DRAFT_402151 [Podila humilis]|nr:MAG: hypothetical protein BYD32DRAFT_402151 [Podila humilis]
MTYNILFLGEAQSGKSTLIEHLRKYADPSYTINKENIGDGIFSHAKDVSTTTIETSLPSYYVSEARERVDYGTFLNGTQEDYEDELNERRKYQLEREQPTTAKVTFNLIDTPGLSDTSLFDETNIATIFKALESIESVNLAVVTVANNPLTQDLLNALKAYIDLFPELNGNIAFVHTRIDYAKLHPHQDPLFAHSLDTKKGLLSSLVHPNIPAPHLLIDNDTGSKRTIRNCITQITLRELLAFATTKDPVRLLTQNCQRLDHTARPSSHLSHHPRKIILVGDKGAGKSTLASMLTSGDLANTSSAPNNALADPTAVVSVHTGRDWTAVDVFGLNDLEGRGVRGADRAIRTLKRALLEARRSCHYLAFVVRKDDVLTDGECDGSAQGADKDGKVKDTEESDTRRLLKLFCKTFAGAEKRFVVIVTHCEEPGWLDRHAKQVAKVFGTVPVVCCNFAHDPANSTKDAGARKEALIRLGAQLETLPWDVAVPWLALEGDGDRGVEFDCAALDAQKEFEQTLGKFLGVGEFIVAVLLNLAKFFRVY